MPQHKRTRRFRPHAVLLPLLFRLRNLKVREYLAYLQETQYWPPDRLSELQLAKLKRLVKHASETVPYYRELFGRLGITAHDIRSLDDVKRLPILTKGDIIDRPASAFLSTHAGRPFAVRKTSGTTGQPVTVLVDRDAYAWSIAARYRCEQWHGIRIGDRQAWFWGRPYDLTARHLRSIRNFALGRRIVNTSVIDSNTLSDQVDRILRYRPDFIYGYTSLLLAFAENLRQRTLELKHLKAVICTAEKVHDFQKAFLGEVFCRPIVEEYGCTEMDILAFDCEDGRRHIIAESVLLEVADETETGMGEILVTDLNNRLMPLIRYKLGDVGSLSADTCSCGRGLPVLSSVEGRSNDQYMVTPDGRKISAFIVFHHFPEDLVERGVRIKQFRIVQEELSEVVAYIVPSRDQDRPVIESFARSKLAPRLGDQIRLRVECVGRIEPTPGKYTYFQPYRQGKELWGPQRVKTLHKAAAADASR